MLQRKNEVARGIVVECRGGDARMTRWFCQAWSAYQTCRVIVPFSQRALAKRAAGSRWHDQFRPARKAKSTVLRNRKAAQRAAGWEDEINDGRKSGKAHDSGIVPAKPALGKSAPDGQCPEMATSPPTIFAPNRRKAVRKRMITQQSRADAPRYIVDDMVDDVLDRLAFLRHRPARSLVIGDWTGALAAGLKSPTIDRRDPVLGPSVLDEEEPISAGPGYDFIASLGTLDTVNDLPGALVHLRRALAEGGLMIACFMAAGSLPALRAIMLEADGDRPSPRIHPQVDVRAGGQLLQRCGFADPVVDSHHLDVRFRSFERLIGDIRAQGLGNCLARAGAPLGKAARARAHEAFAARADADGKVTERFEILTLSGWAKPLRPPRF